MVTVRKILFIIESNMGRNICITVPKSIKWEEYEKEIEAVEDGEQEMNYRLPTVPNDVEVGDRFYVCYCNNIIGWMEITGIGKKDGFNCSTTGRKWDDGNYISRSGEFHYLKTPVPMKSFMGYRYIDQDLD